MDNNRIYKRLKNGKAIESFHRSLNNVSYRIYLASKGDSFQLHSYHLDGNDVFDKSNYKDEKIRMFDDFELLIETLEKEFPELTFKY